MPWRPMAQQFWSGFLLAGCRTWKEHPFLRRLELIDTYAMLSSFDVAMWNFNCYIKFAFLSRTATQATAGSLKHPRAGEEVAEFWRPESSGSKVLGSQSDL